MSCRQPGSSRLLFASAAFVSHALHELGSVHEHLSAAGGFLNQDGTPKWRYGKECKAVAIAAYDGNALVLHLCHRVPQGASAGGGGAGCECTAPPLQFLDSGEDGFRLASYLRCKMTAAGHQGAAGAAHIDIEVPGVNTLLTPPMYEGASKAVRSLRASLLFNSHGRRGVSQARIAVDYSDVVCAHCRKALPTSAEQNKCSRCSSNAVFCGRQCQIDFWPRHKRMCKKDTFMLMREL